MHDNACALCVCNNMIKFSIRMMLSNRKSYLVCIFRSYNFRKNKEKWEM